MKHMTCSEFYFSAVALAFLGGFAFAAVGVIVRFCARHMFAGAGPDDGLRRHYDDAKIIMYLSIVPQTLLLALPIIYPHGPWEIPLNFIDAAVMTSTSLLVLWCWALVCFCRGGWVQLTNVGWGEALPTWVPGFLSVLTIIGCVLRDSI